MKRPGTTSRILRLSFVISVSIAFLCFGCQDDGPPSPIEPSDYSGTWQLSLGGGPQERVILVHHADSLRGRTAYTNQTILEAEVNNAAVSGTLALCSGDLSFSGSFSNDDHFQAAVSISGVSLMVTGEKISADTSVFIPSSVPVASLTVDGDAGDWGTIPPMIEDAQGDASSVDDGGDLKAIYLARSGGLFFLRFDVWGSSIEGSNHYRIWLDDTDEDGCIEGDPEARQIDITFEGGIWWVQAQSMEEPYVGDIQVDGIAAAVGSVLEVSLDLEKLGPASDFVLTGVVRDSDGNDADWGAWSILSFLQSGPQTAGTLNITASRNSVPFDSALVEAALASQSDKVLGVGMTAADGTCTLGDIAPGTYVITICRSVSGQLIYGMISDVEVLAGDEITRTVEANQETDDYFPLALGNRWEFDLENTDTNGVIGVLGTKLAHGVTTYVFGSENGGHPGYATRGRAVVYQHGYETLTGGDHFYLAHAVFLDFEASPSESWIVPDWGTVTLVAKDIQVDVPAGTFTGCYHFGFTGTVLGGFWCAPGVGLVRIDINGQVGELIDYELH